MRKLLFLVFILPGLVFGQVTNNAPAGTEDVMDPTKPHISFDSETFDFGFAPQGHAYLVHAYQVTNTGGAPLLITNVRPTCGCTAAPLKKDKLEPNESTEITAIFRLAGYRHPVSKAIMVMSNDSLRINVHLQFSANLDTAVWRDLSEGPRIFSEPNLVNLGRGDSFVEEAEVVISNPWKDELKLAIIDYTKDFLKKPELKKDNLKSGKSTKLEIELQDRQEGIVEIQASITLAAFDGNDNEVTRITVPIIGYYE
ncbi:DUF1573 domain-containing protein [bacterium]|nr:DUF1573 domain-containing protein [bacterium]